MVVLDQTPFYAESGGQVGDTGLIKGPKGEFRVSDTRKNGELIVHFGLIESGEIRSGEQVEAMVDTSRRDAIRRAHSATHLLHHALQKALGAHAQQRGSKVSDDWLRFDFSNMSAVTNEQLTAIEEMTNQNVADGVPLKAQTLPLEAAKQQGAMMLFGEKYPDPVRMVSIGDFSKELCGGTHLENSSEVKAFEIILEESVSSGTRRIEALTGDKAIANQEQIAVHIDKLADLLGVTSSAIPEAIEALNKKIKSLKKQVSAGKRTTALSSDSAKVHGEELTDYFSKRDVMRRSARLLNVPGLDVLKRTRSLLEEVATLEATLDRMGETEQWDAVSLIEQAEVKQGVRIIVQEVPGSNANLMRQLIDQVRKYDHPAAVFLATTMGGDKIILVAGISRQLVEQGISAGNWVKEIAPIVGGGGGGKADLAQAGGKQPVKLPEALLRAREYITVQIIGG